MKNEFLVPGKMRADDIHGDRVEAPSPFIWLIIVLSARCSWVTHSFVLSMVVITLGCIEDRPNRPTNGPTNTKQYVDLLEIMYVHSCASPETFDVFSSTYKEHFDDAFKLYVKRLLLQLLTSASAEIDRCNQHSNPQWRMKCLQENELAKTCSWLMSMQKVIETDESWLETESGSLCALAKTQTEAIMPGLWEQTIKQVASLRLIRGYLTLRN